MRPSGPSWAHVASAQPIAALSSELPGREQVVPQPGKASVPECPNARMERRLGGDLNQADTRPRISDP